MSTHPREIFFPPMRKVGDVREGFDSSNTCQHRGRVFNFIPSDGKLLVTEAILGDGVEVVEVQTGVECNTGDEDYICCCSLGDKLLVMAGEAREVSAFLVEVGDGRLSGDTVHVTPLAVEGDRE